MDATHKDHLLIQVIKYGLKNNQFTVLQLFEDLKIDPAFHVYIKNMIVPDFGRANENHVMYIIEPRTNPNIRDSMSHSIDHGICVLLPTAIKYYVEHQEIQMATQSAHEAKSQAAWANGFAVAALIVSALVGGVQIYLQLKQTTPARVVKEAPHRDNIDM